ncbi:MAG: YchF/TatD family DNA exonuclease [Candidatus Omnitrophica bacterium]|nr:YchF/TatD family DNA exonuclease [Candidatus Omnitrophota bacterium]
MLIDTHCHLDFKDFSQDLPEVINRAKDSGVGIMLNVGSSVEGSRRSVELSKAHDCIYASVGVHPHEADRTDEKVFAELKTLASSGKVVAIGEVGLDYYRNLSGVDAQKKVFTEFIHISKELGLPLIVHSRDAGRDTLEILKKEFPKGNACGVMHCFSGDKEFLNECLNLGLYISFTCNLTFKNAANLRAVAKEAPLEKLLLETDAPFLAPQQYRGKRNEPSYLVFLAEELSKLHGVSFSDIERITNHNANELFGFNLKEASRIAYGIRDSLYLNITNQCTDNCYFCVRAFTDFVKGHKLKLDNDPSAGEILAELKDIDKYKEVVFCGYGEPTLRLDIIKEVAAFLKKKNKQVRLVTNGHANLINGRSVAGEFKGLIDRVSVSLNVETKEKYVAVCRPRFGEKAFEEIKRFIRECKAAGIEVEVTCLDIPEADIEKCRALTEKELGVDFRLRRYNVVG